MTLHTRAEIICQVSYAMTAPHHQNITRTSPRHHQNITRTSPRHHQNITQMHAKSGQCPSKIACIGVRAMEEKAVKQKKEQMFRKCSQHAPKIVKMSSQNGRQTTTTTEGFGSVGDGGCNGRGATVVRVTFVGCDCRGVTVVV